MTAIAYNSFTLSSYYKMDHVLYEVRDQRGILKNHNYEPWKAEVIADLETSGFIRLEGDKYLITEEGRKVINHDSFLYYNRRVNLQKSEDAVREVLEGKSSKFWAYLLGFSLFFVLLVVIGAKFHVLEFLF